MNKIYKVIWSKVKHQYVVVSELAHSNGKQSRTSRNSIRSRIAALVVCGAITAFGVYGTLPANSVFAAAAETVAGQYIAVAVDANNQGRYSIGDTRTFEDAQGKTHNYTWVNVDGKNYWVREGYTITIENGSRFTAYDKWGNPIAPDNTYIIDSQKSDSADSEGLISSSQVVIGDDSAHTTLTGNKLNSIDAGIYGGAVNTGGTQVPSSFNYYINDNGNGWKDVGEETSVSSMDNFKKVYKMADGTYNTDRRGKGTTVSTDNLYVIDGELGAFFNSNGSVYTGNVYGHNNEVLMTGVENGTYYSYWGTEINDPNTSLSEMTVGDLKKIVGGINDTIYTAQGDDIKQVSVQKSGDNGGTIGLIRRGDWNGTAYEKTDPVPGTITVTSTGGEGKDVAIQFSNDKGSFTVDAGSKVVANNGAGGTDLETISVNGQTFNVIGGAISGQIDSEGNVKIQQGNKVPVTIGKVSDWNVKSGQINGSTLTLTTENAYDGNPKTGTVTIEGVASTNYVDAKDALNVKYDSAEKTSVTLGGKTGTPVKLTNVANGTTTYDAVNFSQLEAVQNAENYVTSGSINNENGTITLNRVQGGDVTIEGLSQYVANKDEYATSAELNGSELTINRHLGEAIKVDLSQLTSGLSGTDYQVVANPAEGSDGVYSVSADGTLKLTVKDLNNPNAEAKEVSINGIAQKDYVDAKDALNVKYDSAEKTSVTLGGKTGTPVKLTNVANGTTTYDAVNFSQLEAVQNAENYVTSGSINNENGTITLNRVQGGDVTIEGLSQYVANKDEYATSAELNGSELTINRHLGEAIKVDLSQLTSGLSGTDYQVVANPAEGSDGVYSVSADGTLKLTVKDLNNPNAEAKEVSINGIAQKDYVDAKDALNVKYDSADKTSVTLGGKGSKTPVKLTNVANGTSTYDAVNFSQLEAVQNAEDYVTSGSIDNANGTITLNRVQGGDVTISGLQDYVNGKDSYVTAAKLEGNKLTITQNNQGKEFSIDLSGLTSGLSGTDYQLVANPINGSGGKYTVDDNGNLTLTVKDLNNPNAATKTITITGLAKKTDVAVVHGKYREGEANNLVDTNAQIWDEAIGVEKSSSIALGNGAFVSVQNGRKADAILFGSDTYTGGIAIGENSKALNATVNIGVKDYKGKMGDVDLSDYKTYEAMGVGETSIGSNSYISGSLSTNIGSYNITTTKYGNTSGILGSLYSAQNFGSVIVGTLNSIESNSSSAGMTSGVANSVIGMANKTQNSNGSLVFGTGNEITNSTASIPSPSSVSGDVADVAENFRDSVSDRNKSNGGAVLAIGGGNKADYAQNSQLIGVQNEITGTSRDISKFNMINGYQNTITNGSNDTVIGTKNTVTNGDSNVVLGDNHAVQDANNNVILGSSDKETTHTASDTVVIGHNAQANGNNDVAIGSGSIANGAVGTEGYAGANPIGTVSVGSEGNERTITNVAAGRINEDSTDAVNGSQLYATNQKVDAGWTATDGTTNIAVNPTETGTTTLKFAGDNNIAVTADAENNAINVELNPDVNLKGEGKNSDNRVWLSGSNGTITVTTENNLSEKTTVINGGNVYVGSSVSVGDKVEITDKDITGLSNTSWNGTTDDESRAATEGQLKDVSDTVNAGWTATDSNGASIVVNPENGSTLNFAGDRNIEVKANEKDGSIDVSLKDDMVLGGKEDTSRVEIGGTNGTIMATKDPNSMAATTTIDGGNVYVGSSISVGDKVEITDKDITGLSNTSWNGTTDDESRAATEGQLKDVSDTVNAGWTATDSNGASIVVNPENGSTLNFAGDRNIEVKANEKDGSIDVSLKDDMVLGGKEDTGNVYVGSSISVGDKVEITDKDITGLSNTEWNGTTTTPDRAATEGQLQQVSNDVNAGWIATDNNGSQVNITPDNNKLNFAGDENITVTAANNEIKVALNDDIVLGDYLNGDDGVLIGGSSGTISATNSITVGEDQGLIIDGQKKEIQGLSNTTWNEKIANDAAVEGSTAASTAATQGQLQEVSKVANAGWTASDGTNSISVKPNETLNFVGDENLTVSADGTDKKLKVSLNDNITLGEGPNQIQLNGAPGANDPALSVGTDKFVVDQDGSLSVSDKFNVDAETGNIYAANNSGSAIMMNDDSVALNAGGNGIAISDEGILLNTNGINEDIKLVTKGTSVSVDSNGTTFTNTNTGETTNINGGTITTNTVKGLDNTTWSEDLAEEVANNEELQGTAATQGQLQQAVSEVAEVANAGWNAKAGGNIINVKPNETLNFEGDGNITVSATSGTSSELKFGLNHNITLDNVENEKTMMVFNTDGREGYIPDNYKEDNGQINDFIEEHGGFAIYYANPSLTTGDMTGTFGVTTDGVVHAKDVISYYSASSGSQSDVIRYSLNDVGDIVTQISHAVFDEGVGSTGMEYTLISDFEDEADKDSPFDAKEGKTRTIGLAVRQDGAVIVGAVVNDEGISSDRGIRINAETKTTYDKNGNEVTNNIATITGLENTEWKPPTPVATFAANDGSATVTSRAATESQLNDLYSAVAAYDVNVDGTIDYSHIALAGTPYGASRSGNGTHTGGTSITNVAYASGKDGSEAVNVDYLNDAISDAAENGSISTSDQHLVANTETGSNGVYKPNDDGNVNLIVSDEKGNSSTITIGDVASKEDLDNLKDDVGDLDYSKVEGDTIIDGDSVTDAIGKLDNKIDNITGTATDADNNTVTGGKINSDGTISLTQKDKDSIKLEGQLTDSGVVQEGTSFDKETGTITITSQDKYSGETSSVKVEGIASTEVVGATNKEDLATAYKDADKDGNATTEYITDSESMVEADVALDHAIQDVAGTSYANDMVLSNRIDSVEKRLGNVEERIDKVGAMAAAIANLRTMGFDPEAPTEIAIGVGQYKSETGIAIGVFHYPNQDFMLSASLSSSGDELMGGIGATWKLGRKSAAERAKDEEARHLEQAEEMKKLAQQEKVKAQAQRHAKLLAERQQASQKNA